jgi:outer membrane protein assembly factor BamB
MLIVLICVISWLSPLSVGLVRGLVSGAAARQTPVGENRVFSPAGAQNIKREDPDETIHLGNLQRTGVYQSRAVTQPTKSEPLSPQLFKLQRANVETWGDWYNFGGRSVYIGGSYEHPSSIRLSAPLFANNLIYFKVDNRDKWESYLYAVDVPTGQLKWKFKAVGGIVSLPTVADGVLYVGVGDGLFYAVDPLTQKVKWHSSSGDKSLVVTSPIVADGRVFFGSDNDFFYALDAQTGKTLWEYNAHGHSLCKAPAVSGDTLYLCTYAGDVFALNMQTGLEKWKVHSEEGAISLTIADGILYYRDGKGHIQSLDAVSGKQLAPVKREHQAGTPLAIRDKTIYFGGWRKGNVFALDAVTQRKKWEYDNAGACSTPIIAENIIYVTCSDNKLYALDAATGEKLWITKPYKATLSAPIIAHGVIYFVSEDGYLHTVR